MSHTAIYESTPLRIFFVVFFLSPVGAVGCETDFHLIDQGKVGYLYHLQITHFPLIYKMKISFTTNGTNRREE